MTLNERKSKGKIRKVSAGREFGTVYLEKYSTAPAPSRDYYGLKVTNKNIIIHHWRISHGPTKSPGYKEFSHTEYIQDRSAQHDVGRVFGIATAEKTLDFALCRGCRLDMLPENILHLLTRFLGYRDICRMSQTSRNLYQMLQTDVVWKPIFRTYFKDLANKEELKLARHGGWRAWCSKIKISMKDRQIMEHERRKPFRTTRRSNRIETIYPHLEEPHIYSSGDAFNTKTLAFPKLANQIGIKYPTLSPREQRTGTIYPLLIQDGLSTSPGMQMSRRNISTSSSMQARRRKDSDNSSNDSAPNLGKNHKKKTLTMYLDLLETKSAPIVVREEEYMKHKRPSRPPNNPNERVSCRQYRLPIPKVLHHPRTRATPLPDIIQEGEFDEIGDIAAPRHKKRIALPKQIRNAYQNDAMKLGIKEKKAKSNLAVPKKIPKLPPTSSATPASKVPSTPAPQVKKEINSIEELNVETLYSAPKKSPESGKAFVYTPPTPVPGQRTFLGGLSEKWSLNRDKSFLDANELLLVEGRYPASLTHIKPAPPVNVTKLHKTTVEPIESFGVIRKRLDASLGQDKEIDEFFDNYMKNVFDNKNKKHPASKNTPSKILKSTEVMKKKDGENITDQIMFPVKSKTKIMVPIKSIIKKESPEKSLMKATKSDTNANSGERKGKNSYPKEAVYAASVANDNGEQLLRKTSSQKLQIKKGEVLIRGANPRTNNKFTLQECKNSPVFKTCREETDGSYITESDLQTVANKSVSGRRYTPKSKMESMMDFDQVLKKKQAELCAESTINMHRAKSASNKTTCVANKTSKARD